MPHPSLTSDVHARHLASRLTRYSFEEINQAWDDAHIAQAEYRVAYLRVHTLLAPFEGFGIFPVYSEKIQPLADLWWTVSASAPSGIDTHGAATDLFPVRKWQDTARKFRTLAKRLNKAYQTYKEVGNA